MKLPPRIAWILVTILICTPYISAQQEITKCEGETAKLSCHDGLVIKVDEANYGRFALHVCNPNPELSVSTSCINEKTKDIVKERCENKDSCEIDVNVNLFGDTCPGTSKYLEIIYKCVKPLPTTTSSTTTTTTARPIAPVFNVTTSKPAAFDHRGDVPPRDSSAEDVFPKQRLPTTPPKPRFCPPVTHRFLEWSKTETGRLARIPCPSDTEGFAEWHCDQTGHWYPATGPNLSGCVSRWSIDLLDNVKHNAQNVGKQNEALVTVYTRSQREQLIGGDLLNVVSILDQVTVNNHAITEAMTSTSETHERNEHVAKLTVKIVNRLLSNNINESWLDLPEQSRRDVASSLLDSIERSLATTLLQQNSPSLSEWKQTRIVEKPFITAAASIVAMNHHVTFPGAPVNQDIVQVPYEALKTSGGSFAKVVYANIDRLNQHLKPKNSTNGVYREVASRIVTVSMVVDGKVHSIHDLKHPVIIDFTLLSSSASRSNPVCVSWNAIDREWTTNGAALIFSNVSTVKCQFNHLTSFAVLMDVSGKPLSPYSDDVLTRVSNIILPISIICTSMTFVVYFVVSDLYENRNFIHLNLALSLTIAEIIFYFGIDHTDNKDLCSYIAAAMHFWFLSAFAWMLLEGIELYNLIRVVFKTKNYKWYILCLVCYVVPGVFVSVLYSWKPDCYGTEQHCWITTKDNFILSFVVPVSIVVFINLGFFFLTLWTVCNRYSACKTDESKKLPRKWVVGSLALSSLLGTAWIIGCSTFVSNNIYIASSFVIINGLQGVGIFVFHVLLNEKIRKDIRSFVRKNDGLPDCIRSCFMDQQSTAPYTQSRGSLGTESGRNSSPSQTPPRNYYTRDYDLAAYYDEQEPFLQNEFEFISRGQQATMPHYVRHCVDVPTAYYAVPAGGRSATLGRVSSRIPEYPGQNGQHGLPVGYSTNRLPPHAMPPSNRSIVNGGEVYDYATIPYNDQPQYAQQYYPAPGYRYGQQDYYYPSQSIVNGVIVDGTSVRAPPRFKPPPPPSSGISALPMSDDSAYSDSCGSFRPTPERSPNSMSGRQVLRMDLTTPTGLLVRGG